MKYNKNKNGVTGNRRQWIGNSQEFLPPPFWYSSSTLIQCSPTLSICGLRRIDSTLWYGHAGVEVMLSASQTSNSDIGLQSQTRPARVIPEIFTGIIR